MGCNVQVVLLCEDRQQEAFLRRFLTQTGKSMRMQRVERSPKGRGAGEQFVRAQFAKEVAFYRSRAHRVEQALVVMIDADKKPVGARAAELAATLTEPLRTSHRVAVFSPGRNIETWIAYLDGQTVNESDEYPRLDRQSDCQQHVDALVAMCRENRLRQPSPPSLDAACVEYRSRLA